MNEAAPREIRARVTRILETREEISLVFGADSRQEAAPGRELVINKATQIILSPPAAKRFFRLLKEMVARYESDHGIIGELPFATNGQSGRESKRREHLLSTEHLAGRAEELRLLVENLGAHYGLEHSFKIFSGTILSDRCLIAVNRKSIMGGSSNKLLHLCRQINMPRRFQSIYFEHLTEANIVLFGYEGDEVRGTYKAYLEFGDMFNTNVREYPGKPSSFLIHLGFKWDAEDNQQATLARYTCHPLFSEKEILERIRDNFYGRKETPLFEVVRGIVARAAQTVPAHEFLYIEVKEENNPRQSYDVNVYRANLTMEEVYPWLREACRIQGIDTETFHGIYEPMKTRIFGHVSGGIDRNGRDFLTFYYGMSGSTL